MTTKKPGKTSKAPDTFEDKYPNMDGSDHNDAPYQTHRDVGPAKKTKPD